MSEKDDAVAGFDAQIRDIDETLSEVSRAAGPSPPSHVLMALQSLARRRLELEEMRCALKPRAK